MKIFLKELSTKNKDFDFSETDDWLNQAVMDLDEKDNSPTAIGQFIKKNIPSTLKPERRPVAAHYSLRKVDDIYIAAGKIDTYCKLVCSRCANGFEHPISARFQSLFTQIPEMAGYKSKYIADKKNEDESGSSYSFQKSFKQNSHHFNLEDDSEDMEIDFLEEEFIDLALISKEQLRLRIPFQPLCKSGCKGICSNCGTNLNEGKCACNKILSANPFAALNKIKTKSQPS